MSNLAAIVRSIGVLFLASLWLASPIYAQEVPAEEERELQTEFMMLNQHVCPYDNMDEMMTLAEEEIAPILDEMQAEGEISDWGILTHAWGDEYNFNFFVVADDQRTFLDAFDLFGERSAERETDWIEEWESLCTMHKDNMYTLHRYGRPDAGQ